MENEFKENMLCFVVIKIGLFFFHLLLPNSVLPSKDLTVTKERKEKKQEVGKVQYNKIV